ncbi:hypothetical protein B0H67DRAFT_647398 [Lasiosphaeris hirsuta]|uniref:Ketoreductase domain-containing protein n=1 Tax=Lasiosphaeris hirsuta TaxID=260670 RepID=A0AA40AA51_9PEZI|nr:hypothetical protein B0H67DRAFT_647398 [Lasiosphaeris hirsuta]
MPPLRLPPRLPALRRLLSTSPPPPRTAIITGAARGIGKAIALRLARDGYDITVNDLPASQPALDAVVAEIHSLGRRARAHAADISGPDAAARLVAESVETLGPLTAMVANAGIAHAAPVLEVSAGDFERVVRGNVMGVQNCFQAAGRVMVEQGAGGRLIAAASVAAFKASPGLGGYSASKWAIRGLVQVYAMELGRFGITANAYAPGVVDTRLLRETSAVLAGKMGVGREDMMERLTEAIALGRTGVPEDVAGVVGFLAGREAGYVTGQTLALGAGFPSERTNGLLEAGPSKNSLHRSLTQLTVSINEISIRTAVATIREDTRLRIYVTAVDGGIRETQF